MNSSNTPSGTPPIAPELLEILVCPETHQSLTIAPPETVAKLNALQAQGALKNKAGQPVAEPLDSALVREDGQVAYAILTGIPVMLIEEQIALKQIL